MELPRLWLRRRNVRRSALLIGLVLAASACAEPLVEDDVISAPLDPPAVTTSAPQSVPAVDDRLGEARARWTAAGLDSYRYEFLDDCGECDQQPPGEIVVWDGDVLDPIDRAPSVEEAFDLIESSLAAGQEVEATYHPELGYPTDVWIDREDRAFDGGTHWVLSDVTEGLPGDAATLSNLQDARVLWQRSGIIAYEFRTSFLCDCEVEGSVWTRVENGLVTDWSEVFVRETDSTVTPITINQLFADLEEMIGSGEAFVDSGLSVTGSALYDAEYGYPVWIGLDIEVVDPQSPAASLGPRLVFVISDFNAIAVEDAASELNLARQRWLASGITSYTFEVTSHDVEEASFSDPYLVTVRDGELVEITQNGELAELGEDVTVEVIFEMIARLSADGVDVDAIYHTEFGYPVVVLFIAPDGSSTGFSISNLSSG